MEKFIRFVPHSTEAMIPADVVAVVLSICPANDVAPIRDDNDTL